MGGDNNKRKALGRGLSALFDDFDGKDSLFSDVDLSNDSGSNEDIVKDYLPQALPLNSGNIDDLSPDYHKFVDVDDLFPNRMQPRKHFDDDALSELALSIKKSGLIQPILVRESPSEDKFEIIAGERRWRSAKKAGLKKVPIIVKSVTDSDLLEIALIENIQRANLNPMEEANAFQLLIKEMNYTQKELSDNIGKSRSYIANSLRLLSLPGDVQILLEQGKLSLGHAKIILSCEENISEISSEIVKKQLSVRETEKFIKNLSKNNVKLSENSNSKRYFEIDRDNITDILSLERDLSNTLNMKVSINLNEHGEGSVKIYYASLEELDDICKKISGDTQ